MSFKAKIAKGAYPEVDLKGGGAGYGATILIFYNLNEIADPQLQMNKPYLAAIYFIL